MDQDERQLALLKIFDELFNLSESPLYEYRIENNYFPVLGDGNLVPPVMFIGEAPGEKEAQKGRAFIGASGYVLEEMLESVGLSRSDVYMTNIVKDRPPNNRDITKEEIDLYSPFLIRQLEILKPRVIATLGREPMKYVMEQSGVKDWERGISRIHGMIFEGELSYGKIKIIPLYHPATTLYNPALRPSLQQDFQIIKRVIGEKQSFAISDLLTQLSTRNIDISSEHNSL